jgi:hypothetical protein
MTHDPESLFLARVAVRQAYEAVRRLPQGDCIIRCLVDDLDRMCVELTVEIESWEPELTL